MKKLSQQTAKQVKRVLPVLRNEIEEELTKWDEYTPSEEFYSDQKVIEVLPYTTHEYLIIQRELKVDKETLIEWLNDGLFIDILPKVVSYTLRRLTIKK